MATSEAGKVEEQGTVGIGLIGGGAIGRVHSLALSILSTLFTQLGLRPKLVAVADIDLAVAHEVASRFAYSRAESDWQAVVRSPDVDLVCVCLPPALNHTVVLAAAAAGKHVFCEKPLASTPQEATEILAACETAGVFHSLGTSYRWAPAVRALRELISTGEIGEVRHFRGTYFLDYASTSQMPLVWRFRKDLAGGGAAADTGYHLIDIARFLVGEITSVTGLTARFVHERPLDSQPNNDLAHGSEILRSLGPVDVEDAAAALVTFEHGAYGVLETSRVATGRRLVMRLEVYGSQGSLDWELERDDEFQMCLAGDDGQPPTFRRVLINRNHPGAQEFLIAGAEGTGVGWLGQQMAMWAEFLTALSEQRPGSANFVDGVRANAVLDAWYASASSGVTVPVAYG